MTSTAVTNEAARRRLLRWGPGEQDYVRGVNLMRIRDGRIVDGMGYVKG